MAAAEAAVLPVMMTAAAVATAAGAVVATAAVEVAGGNEVTRRLDTSWAVNGAFQHP